VARQQRSNNPRFAQEPAQTIRRVALYARVSTLNNQDPEMQLRELREFSERRGWQISDEYIDQGVSGCKESRPALNRLMSDACRRRFDAILVWKIDRLCSQKPKRPSYAPRTRTPRSKICSRKRATNIVESSRMFVESPLVGNHG
jgi:DNA invertase Pin-like site-specific DNA recombinase